MLATVQALAGGLDADQAGAFARDVGVEDAHGVAATADAGEHRIGLLGGDTLCGQHLGHLCQALGADHALEVAHHHGVGVRACHGADDVESVVHIGHPVAHGFVQRVLQRLAARFDRHHGGAQQLHAVDVGALALDVFAAHVDHAFQAVARTDGGGGHAVLAGAGLGDDARLAHAPRQHGLADDVVDLVRAGVVEVFALQVDLRAPQLAAGAGGVVDGRGAAHVVREFVSEFGQKVGVVLVLGVGVLQLVDGVGEGFADEAAAVAAEVPAGVGLVVVGHVWVCWAKSASAARTAATNW